MKMEVNGKTYQELIQLSNEPER